jgi:hypothetical protein
VRPAGAARRLTVRDAQGVRVADLHTEAGASLALRLPGGPLGAFELVAAGPGQARPQLLFRPVPEGQSQLDELAPQAPTLASRGEAPVFEALFRDPFGPQAYQAYLAQPPAEAPPTGISTRDVDRLRLTLLGASNLAEDRLHSSGATMIAMVPITMGMGLGLSSLLYRQDRFPVYVFTMDVALGLAAGGATAFLLTSEEKQLYQGFTMLDLSTEAARAQAVLTTEHQLQEKAELRAQSRMIGAGLFMVASGALLAYSGYRLHQLGSGPGGLQTWYLDRPLVAASGGALSLGLATLGLLMVPTPIERTWEAYQRGEPGLATSGQPPSLSLRPALGAPGAPLGLTLQGSF